MIALTLPYPPSVNRYWRSVQGRVLISKEGRQYRDAVFAAVFGKPGSKAVSGADRVRFRMIVNPPDRRRRDLDNTLKAVCDSLTHAGVWQDDSQVDELTVTRGEMKPGGEVTVIVERM